MSKQLIVNFHLEVILTLDYLKAIPVDDEGVAIFAAIEVRFLNLMEDLAINGQFRFATDQRIVNHKVVESLSYLH